MATELEVLGIVSDRLSAQGLPFMLTGSFALAYYATPRMTRDLDLVVSLAEADVGALVASFSPDFYIDADTVREAIRSERLFNLMHFESGIKVDLMVRKSAEYRQAEFARRHWVSVAGIRTWSVTCEDLILSKLVWARDSGSELQLRDARQLLTAANDVSDTAATVAALVAERHREMTPAERWEAASSMFETARAIVESSLPADLSDRQRRLAIGRRLYGDELPARALEAFSSFKGGASTA